MKKSLKKINGGKIYEDLQTRWINLTQQYISELINYNEEVNIRMFYSTFEEDQYISILNDQDQEVSFNFVNDSIEIELIDPLCENFDYI